MTYRIEGLAPEPFQELYDLSDDALSALGVLRVTATSTPGFPCRITLEDAEPGETLLLLNHVSHDVTTPFRASHAIYVREGAAEPAVYEDEVPYQLARRHISLRAFAADGMLKTAALAAPGETDRAIRDLFARDDVAYIHAHNAAAGCFAARIDRS